MACKEWEYKNGTLNFFQKAGTKWAIFDDKGFAQKVIDNCPFCGFELDENGCTNPEGSVFPKTETEITQLSIQFDILYFQLKDYIRNGEWEDKEDLTDKINELEHLAANPMFKLKANE